jgi:hypothetical protein
MTGNVTITSKTGPDIESSALLFTNVSDIDFQLASGIVQFVSNGRTLQYSLTEIATVTFTISGAVATITMS